MQMRMQRRRSGRKTLAVLPPTRGLPASKCHGGGSAHHPHSPSPPIHTYTRAHAGMSGEIVVIPSGAGDATGIK